ncbi:MAG: hypothetical protein AAF268_08615 [Cyanobacteria bacterium P01_A01_bin.3]
MSGEQGTLLDYVADMQLHMALQSRNLVPGINSAAVDNSRLEMLTEAQAASEKTASRQWL